MDTRAHPETPRRPHRWSWLILVLLAASLACAMPFAGGGSPTPTIAPTATSLPKLPTATPQPQPAALVESDPPLDTEVALEGPITLYFNQPMDRPSTEAALTSQLQQDLRFEWLDDTAVVIYLSQTLQPETNLVFELGPNVRSAGGKPLFKPVRLSYHTASYLRLLQSLPTPDATEVDPTGAVVAAFSRPIVPLGADPATLPAAFTLSPPAQGRGEWLNTSTYAFYPEPSLEGGRQYNVTLNPDLKSVKGGPLKEGQSWSFTTALPQWLSVEPISEQPWPLDPKVKVTFNQPMEPASVEAGLQLMGPGGQIVNGQGSWNDNNTVYTFKPAGLLARETEYKLNLPASMTGVGGTPLQNPTTMLVLTVPPLGVSSSEPAQGQAQDSQRSVMLYLNAPIKDKDLESYVHVNPPVGDMSVYYDENLQTLMVHGQYAPNSPYTLQLDAGLEDIWGGTMAQPYILNFSTLPLRPDLAVPGMNQATFLRPQEPSLVVQAVNLSEVPLSLGSISLPDFLKLQGPNEYELLRNYRSPDQRDWTQPLTLESDRYQPVELFLSPDQGALSPGLYLLRFNFPENQNGFTINNGPYFIVVSNVQITYKVGATDALAWVVDLRSGAALAGAPVTIYDEDGTVLASGQTDAQGVFRATFAPRVSAYNASYAVVGQPGDDTFGIAVSTWNMGVAPYQFGLDYRIDFPAIRVYYYTDRPIYRPGQTVFFRAVVREEYNGRYSAAEITTLPVRVLDDAGQELAQYDLPLSSYGTANGSFDIPADARPGSYQIFSKEYPETSINFTVASYRKPEIDLKVSFASDQIQAGQKMLARISARYFFDAPAGDLPVRWTLFAANDPFSLPGYQVGLEDNRWLESQFYPDFSGPFGRIVDHGEGRTGPDGTLALDFPTEATDARLRYTLEVTAEDESRLPVSTRDSMLVNPDVFFIGLKADANPGRAGEQAGFEVMTVDWNGAPAGGRNLKVDFQKVTWERKEPAPGDIFGQTVVTPRYAPVASAQLTTSAEGLARVTFTPPEPGTYMVDVSNAQTQKGARSQLYYWVGGPGQAVWPDLPNSRLRLSANQASFRPGDTARVFIPNPFGTDAPTLLTVERSTVFSHQILTVPAEGYLFELPLGSDQAPNVYLSVTQLGRTPQGRPDFRQGYLELPVEPVEQTLQARLASEPKRLGPGEPVTFDLLVTDSQGNPVQGEFSLAVVDLAVLALADPNSPDIVTAFYQEQPIAVNTSLTLAAYNRRVLDAAMGGAGGGGEMTTVVREKFPDTAYWNAQIVTGPDGRAQVSVDLPDNLTTWQVDLRGLTVDTRVGQAEDQIVTTKPMLVRPVTPRFLVANDHAQVAALVQNNTTSPLTVRVSLNPSGFTLDDPAAQTQTVEVPAGGRARVEWWGTAQDAESIDLVFAAEGQDASGASYQDAARPALGALPVAKYLAPFTFQTAGVADQADEIIELISLPRSFSPQAGQLNVELSPSLLAAMLRGLDALSAPEGDDSQQNTEQLLSELLPNIELYRTQQQFGLQTPGLKQRLDRALNSGYQRLLARQNPDGGWSWELGSPTSDPYVSTYALFTLGRAGLAGINVNPDVLRRAVEYVNSVGLNPGVSPASPYDEQPAEPVDRGTWPQTTWELDRIAFMQYALTQAGSGDPAYLAELDARKTQLSPWGQALLALAFEKLTPGSPQARTLLSDLQTTAIRSASGASWEFAQDEAGFDAAQRNMHTGLSNSAVVLFALAQADPAAPLVADGVRYLMNSRNAAGAWGPSYGTAWALMALNEVVKGTGELDSNYAFGARLNGSEIASGKAGGGAEQTAVVAQTPSEQLYPSDPNELVIWRDGSSTTSGGRLYYTAGLQVGQPAAQVQPLGEGMSLERRYYPLADACPTEPCDPLQSAQTGEKVRVALTLSVPKDLHFVSVSDFIPAGAEILDNRLNTSELGMGYEPEVEVTVDPRRPFQDGFGMTSFNQPQIYDNRIVWTADVLPAGVYELVYTLVMLQPGQYRLIPAQAGAMYFPDVQAHTAGGVFEIKP